RSLGRGRHADGRRRMRRRRGHHQAFYERASGARGAPAHRTMSTQNTLPPEHDADWQIDDNEGARLMHDLRGPLAVIRGHARLLAGGKRGLLNEEQARSMAVIE